MSQTFTVPSAMRGGSPAPIVLGPFAVPPGTTDINVAFVMTTADLLSTSPVYAIDIAVDVQYGTGKAFDPAVSQPWESGPDSTGPRGIIRSPGFNIQVDPSATQVRARLTIPTAVKLGANVTVLP